MATAEHQRPRTVESGGEGHGGRAHRRERQREEGDIERSEHDPHAPADPRLGRFGYDVPRLSADKDSREGSEKDDSDLRPCWRRKRGQDQRQAGNRRPGPVWTQGLSHSHHSLSDNGDRDQLEAVQQAVADRPLERALAIGE